MRSGGRGERAGQRRVNGTREGDRAARTAILTANPQKFAAVHLAMCAFLQPTAEFSTDFTELSTEMTVFFIEKHPPANRGVRKTSFGLSPKRESLANYPRQSGEIAAPDGSQSGAAADAQRCAAQLQIFADHGVNQGDDDTQSGAANGMAQSDTGTELVGLAQSMVRP